MVLQGIEREICSVLGDDSTQIRGYGLGRIRKNIAAFLDYDEKENESQTLARRKDMAVEMAGQILDEHSKASTFAEPFEFLRMIEIGAQFFDENLRDHLIHSFCSYLLGLYFMRQSDRINSAMSGSNRANPLVWKLTALLHDIGYPVETLHRQIDAFFQKIRDFRQTHISLKRTSSIRSLTELSEGKRVQEKGNAFLECFESLETLYRHDNVFELIEGRLAELGFDIDLKKYFYGKAGEGCVDHGILSAIIVLNLIDALYAEHNRENLDECIVETVDNEGYPRKLDWGRKWFDNEIVDAASFISLHNLVDKPIMQDYRISLARTPVLYLLLLSDNIQVWRRHSVFREIYSPERVKISFTSGEILCSLSIADEEKLKVKNTIENKLNDEELTVKVL